MVPGTSCSYYYYYYYYYMYLFYWNYYTCTNLVKPLKALMISMSVGCIRAYQKIILKFSSTNNLLWVHGSKEFSGSASTVDGPEVRTYHSDAYSLTSPSCPPRWSQHHGWTGMHIRVMPPLAGSLCPNQMRRNATHWNNLCRNETARIIVLSHVTKKTRKKWKYRF